MQFRPGTTMALAVLLGAAGCTMRKSAVWIESGSTAQRLVLGVARERRGTEPVVHLNYVAVRSCFVSKEKQQTFWQARGDIPAGQQAPTRIVYGTAPDGFSNEVTARPLSAGCYEEIISGNGISGTARFVVNPDGSVIEQRAPNPAS